MGKPSLRARAEILIPFALGLIACWFATGWSGLAPGNIHWLTQSDLAQSYLGWAFYRHDPWTSPFGASPSYGLEFHASVLYSDSIPLLAMPFKWVAVWLPEPFQYFGLWLVLCFLLQAWFAWRLLGLASEDVGAKTCGLVFFVLAPPMLNRLGGHLALFAHWPLLAALYLYLRGSLTNRQGTSAWMVLVPLTFLIHVYVFLMVAGIWAADVLRRAHEGHRVGLLWKNSVPWREVLLVPVITAVAAWQAGFFLVPGKAAQADGFGFYKMNLLAPFNGAGWAAVGWNGPTGGAGEYEGFNYLGFGGLALCLAGFVVWLFTRKRQNGAALVGWPLWLLALVFALLAVTNTVGFGMRQWHLSLPFGLEHRLAHSPVQATGRLFWVMYYLLLTRAFFALARVLRPRLFAAVVAGLAVLQCADIQAGVRNLRAMQAARAETATETPLGSVFWNEAASRYKRVRLLPTRVLAPGWEAIAFYAQRHGMGTDAVQLARVNWKIFNRLRTAQRIGLLRGRPEEDTLYIVDERFADLAIQAARPGDAVFALDGYRIFAPGWGAAVPLGAVDLRAVPPQPGSIRSLPFSSGLHEDAAARLLLGEGWRQNADGVSIADSTATLFVPRGDATELALDWRAVDAAHPITGTIEAMRDGRRIGGCPGHDGSCRSWRLPLAREAPARGFDEIALRMAPPIDRRRPSIALERVSLETTGAAAQGAMERSADGVSAPLTAVR